MARGVELATGYVTLAAETSTLAKQVSGIFKGADGQASAAGKSMGKAMAKGFDITKPDVDALAAEVTRAEQRVAAQAEASAKKQADAKRKVEIAQAKLNETTEKYGAKSSQALTAVDRLATSEQKLEAETLQAADAQRKLQAELKQSKDALSTASKSSDTASKTYAKGWKGVGQRIKAQLKGGVKQATDAAEDQAERGGKEAGSGFSSSFKGAIGGLAAGFSVAAVVGGIRDVSDAAGQAEQSVGAIDSVFKGNSGAMHEWSKDAKTAVGVSANEYRELGTLIGAQLKNAKTPMDQLAGKTNDLIKTGADLSSMFGGSTKEAVDALSSALKGEMDPIERYGITLNEAALKAVALKNGLIEAEVDSGKVSERTQKMALAQEKYNIAVKKYGKGSTQAKSAALSLTSAENLLKDAQAGKIPSLDSATKAMAVQLAVAEQSADAQGNFAREEGTYEHKRQVAIASWQDMKEKIGGAFLPALASAMGFVSGTAIPAIGGLIEGLKAAAGWVKDNSVWIVPLATGVGAAAAAWAIWTGGIWLWTAATKASTTAFKAFTAAMKANWIFLVIGAIVALVAAVVWLYKNNETARTIIDGAWTGIKNAVKFAWEAMKIAFSAIVAFVRDKVAPVFVWIYENIIKPVWQAIKIATVVAVAIIIAVIDGLVWVWKNVLAPAITWAWENVIKPVFAALGSFFKWVWESVLKPAFDKVMAAFKAVGTGIKSAWDNTLKPVFNAIGAVFKWVWDTILSPYISKMITGYKNLFAGIKQVWTDVLKPVFNAIGSVFKSVYDTVLKPAIDKVKGAFGGMVSGISGFWNDKLKPVFRALGSFVRDSVVPVFKKGVDKIKAVWESIKEFAKKPIKFVIDTVINDGLIGAFNKVAGWIPGVKTLDKVKIPGFARGGWTGPGSKYQEAGVVHADEFVIRKESQRDIARNAPGLLDGLNRFGAKALGYAGGGLVHPMDPRNRGVSAGWHGYPGHKGTDYPAPVGTPVYSPGAGTVAQTGWNLPGGTGKQVWINHDNGLMSRVHHLSQWLVKAGQRVGAGQAIGKVGMTGNTTGPHAHWGVMNGGQYLNPASIWGTGAGGSGDFYGGGGGFDPMSAFSGLTEKVGKWFSDRFPGGGQMVDMAKGIGGKLIGDVKDWAIGKLSGVGDFASDVVRNISGNSPKQQVRGVAEHYGWNKGNQWASLNELIRRESSWNPNAANPNSSARGLFQKMTSLHGPIEATADGQAKWGLNYIKERYGNPQNAINFHDRNGHYASGGLVKGFLHDQGGVHEPGTWSFNGLKKPEAVLNPRQWDIAATAVDQAAEQSQWPTSMRLVLADGHEFTAYIESVAEGNLQRHHRGARQANRQTYGIRN